MVRAHGSLPEFLTVEEVAGVLQVGKDTVRRWIRNRSLDAKFFGGRTGYRIARKDLSSFLNSRDAARGNTAEGER